MGLTAQRLVLDLLSAARGKPTPVRALVMAANLFGISDNNLRVTLARLLARGLIARDERGQYRLAEGAEPVQSHVASWTSIERRMVPWRGGWIGVHTAALPRSKRKALRRRTRAFEFLGFRELAPELWVRPDNLTGGVQDTRARLHQLGLETRAPVFAMTEFDDALDLQARALWDVDALHAGYRTMLALLDDSRRRLSETPLPDALVETFVLGGQAIRLLVFDPLLPEPIVPGEERRALVTAMRRYDVLGRSLWSQFMLNHGGSDFESLLQYQPIDAAAGRSAAVGGGL